MNAPGKVNGQPFFIRMYNYPYRKGDVIKTSKGLLLKVLRTYRMNWWRKIIKWLGFKLRPEDYIKVKYIGQTLGK